MNEQDSYVKQCNYYCRKIKKKPLYLSQTKRLGTIILNIQESIYF